MLRLSAALFITPMLAVAIYFFGYLLLSKGGGASPPDLSAFIFGLLPFAYVGTLIIWVPIVVIYEKKNRRKLLQYSVAGGLLGAVFGAIVLSLPSENTLTIEAVVLVGIASVLGCLFAVIFWMVAFFRTN